VQTIKAHFTDLGSGRYAQAFGLMVPSYRAGNPSWIDNRAAADPGITIVAIGKPRPAATGVDIPIEFYARDRNPTPGSDTSCRRFKGTVNAIEIDGRWRYNPLLNHLNATVITDGDPRCPS
jgi:hypothetical protein